MTGQIVLTPDELAQMVGRVMDGCGLPSDIVFRIETEDGQLLAYKRAVVVYDMPEGLKPAVLDADSLRSMLNPTVSQ